MCAGLLAGIPLTLLQYGVHLAVDPVVVANNFLLAGAIYDADRLTDDAPASARLTSRAAALASTSVLASTPATAPLAPLVPALHLGYRRLKPRLAAAKPLVVAVLWTILVCDVPALSAGASLPPATVHGALLLNIAAFSHAVDVVDIEEDLHDGVHTPAVLMGRAEAQHYALALQLGSVALDLAAPNPHLPYDLVALVVLGGILAEVSVATSAATSALILVALAASHDLELAMFVLRSTEMTHQLAVDAAIDLTTWCLELPDALRRPAINGVLAVINGGDDVGGQLLRVFEAALRRRLH